MSITNVPRGSGRSARPREYVTEISVPTFDTGIQRMCSHMRELEPLPEPEDPEAGQ